MDSGMSAPSRERDVPEKVARINGQLETYAKLIAELRERAKPIVSMAPRAKAEKSPMTPAMTPLGNQLLDIITKLSIQNDDLEEVIHSFEV